MANTKIENILDINDEVLAMIFSYIQNHENLSLVCTKFHEISCNYKFCGLTIRHEHEDQWKLLDDQHSFNSLIKSTRRIKCLTIWGYYKHLHREHRLNCLTQIVERFGRDIKILDISYADLSDNIIDLLSLMPKLEKISLRDVCFPGAVIDNKKKLSRLKLKELGIRSCDPNTMNIFTTLPNVLQKVELFNFDIEDFSSIKPLGSQHKIKELIIDERSAGLLNLNQLKLITFNLRGNSRALNLEKILKGQNELNSLKLWSLYKGGLNFISNELKSLKQLEVNDVVSVEINEFAEMSKLKKLSQLELAFRPDSELREALSFMAISNLEQLNLTCYLLSLTEPIVKQLGVNLPKLKKLVLRSTSSLTLINSIIHNMSNLEDLDFHRDCETVNRFIAQENLRSEKMKTLVISGEKMDLEELPKLIGCLKKLNSLSIESDWNISASFVERLKENIGSLKLFICDCNIAETILKNGLIQQKFSDIFPVIDCSCRKWVMRK